VGASEGGRARALLSACPKMGADAPGRLLFERRAVGLSDEPRERFLDRYAPPAINMCLRVSLRPGKRDRSPPPRLLRSGWVGAGVPLPVLAPVGSRSPSLPGAVVEGQGPRDAPTLGRPMTARVNTR
jgi:hypothetical protein